MLATGCSSPQPQLDQAVKSDDAATVQSAIGRGADVNATSSPDIRNPYAGHRPLVAAIQMSRMESVPALLKGGADPNLRDKSGYTPLHLAVANANVGLTQTLLEAGADPNAGYVPPTPPSSGPIGVGIPPVAGQTPLMVAAGQRSARRVEMLLQKGARPDLKDARGRTALWYAYAVSTLPRAAQVQVDPEMRRIRQLLLEAGANATRSTSRR